MPEEKKEVPLHRERLGLLDKEAQGKLLERKRKLLSSDMAVCFNTPEGRRVLRYIMTICGYKKSKIGGNAALGMDILQGTYYNAAREQICLELIEFIPDYILKDAEFGIFSDLET
jgi:hypothetical protein